MTFSNLMKIAESATNGSKNTVGKGKIARYEQFLLFRQGIQNTFTADTQKPGLIWERVNSFQVDNILVMCKLKVFACNLKCYSEY